MAENYFGITDVGKVRTNNEDTFFTESVLKDTFIAACVIDGVGGYEGGEIAAAIARESILEYMSVPSGTIPVMMREALLFANTKIVAEKKINSRTSEMACVVTLALIEKNTNKFYYAHIGDTRLYLYRDQSLVKITKDHSFVGFLEDSGRLKEEAAMDHPKRNEVNKALGYTEQIPDPIDYIETGESPFLPGDIILLCSDGLSDMVTREEISAILAGTADLKAKCQQLIDAANKAGGKDNVTVVLVHNDREPVKARATKPQVKKNETQDVVSKSVTTAAPLRPIVKNKGIIRLLTLLCVGFAGAFLWQWMQNQVPDQTTPSTLPAGNTTITGNRFVDTIKNHKGSLVLSPDLFGNMVTVSSLYINNDSISIVGNGKTVITKDSSSRSRADIMIGPDVKYILFDSLIMQDINIYIGQNTNALHFKRVSFSNSALWHSKSYTLPDSLLTGPANAIIHNDSLLKKPVK